MRSNKTHHSASAGEEKDFSARGGRACCDVIGLIVTVS